VFHLLRKEQAMIPGTKIVGWAGDAQVLCVRCASRCWNFHRNEVGDQVAVDGAGDDVMPVFASDETEDEFCDECGENLIG
jgi:hypothetical protein